MLQDDSGSDDAEEASQEAAQGGQNQNAKPIVSKKSLKEANKAFLKSLHSSKAYKATQKQKAPKSNKDKLKSKKTAKSKRMKHHNAKKIVNSSGRK